MVWHILLCGMVPQSEKKMIQGVIGLKRFISNILTVCFICYMILLAYYLFFSEEYGRDEFYPTYQYNLHLFRELKRYFDYRNRIGIGLFLVNVVGNVAAFMPFGFLVPVLYREQRGKKTHQGRYFRSFLFVTFLGFLFSLSVETVQLITKVGCFDVDDLMLNTLGVMVGYIGYFISKVTIGKYQERKKQHGGGV